MVEQALHAIWRASKYGLKYAGLLGCTLLLVIGFSGFQPVQAQLTPLNVEPTAPVIINGRKVLEVRGVGTISAVDRAQSLSERLQREVQQLRPSEIEVVVEDDGTVYLKSSQNDVTLATVTEVDLRTPSYSRQQQAEEWKEILEPALRDGWWELQPAFFQQALVYGTVVLAAAIALHLLLKLFGRRSSRVLNRWFAVPGNPLSLWEKPIKFFWQLGIVGLKAGLWLVIFTYITGLFPQLRIWRYTLYTLLVAESITIGDQQYSALRLLLLVGLTIGLWLVTRLIAQLFRFHILARARFESRLQDVLSILMQYGLLFLGTIILLQAFGINASSLAILASLLGVGIGFGVQNITNNFISGFIITLERPIQAGDFIKIGELVGIVKQVGARSTEVTTLDKVTIIVPNSRFLESEVINWSHGNPISRLKVPVGVAYGCDIAKVKIALLEAVKRHPEVLLKPEPEVWFQSFGDSSLNFEVMVWTGDPRKQFRVKSDLNYAIEASLRHHGIEIPFPQQDLHLRSPQLDEILNVLKQRSVGVLDRSLQTTEPPPAEPTVEQTTDQEPLPDLLANLDVEALAEAMQGSQGVTLQPDPDQPELPSTYFTGAAAVTWLKQNRDYTHEGAILVGQWLLQKGLIHATIDGGDFENSQALYQFYQDSPAGLAKSVESPLNPVISDGDITEISSPTAH